MTVLAAALSLAGVLNLSMNHVEWLRADTVAVRHHAQWMASDCSALAVDTCTPLAASKLVTSNGTDAWIGEFIEDSVEWTNSEESFHFRTSVRSYPSIPGVVLLRQAFPDGLEPRNKNGRTDEVVSSFPSLSKLAVDVAVLKYEGVQLQNTRVFGCYCHHSLSLCY